MQDTLEICMAGGAVHTLGATIQMPYLNWSPRDVAELTETDRMAIVQFIRERRQQIAKSVKR